MTDRTDKKEILRVEDLCIGIRRGRAVLPVVEHASFTIREGERWAIAGESGAGKSMTMNAITALLPSGSTEISGRILFRDPCKGWQDLMKVPPRQRHRFVSEQVAMIFQDSINALNPNERIMKQWSETILLHRPQTGARELEEHILERMEVFGVRGGKETLRMFPDQLSGGMRQRIAIAMALESRARILIADEPTTSLDAITQRSTIEFIEELLEKRGLTLLFISHNLGILQHICDHIIIMKDGRIVEQGETEAVFSDPQDEYTKQLIRETRKIMGREVAKNDDAEPGFGIE